MIQGAVGASKIRRETKARIEKEDAATTVLDGAVKGRAARNDLAQKDAAAQSVQGLMSGSAVRKEIDEIDAAYDRTHSIRSPLETIIRASACSFQAHFFGELFVLP